MNAYVALLELSKSDGILGDTKFIISEFFANTDDEAVLVADQHTITPEKWGAEWTTCTVVKIWNINHEVSIT